MGLHNTAHYLKTKGRGNDTELVHMDKGELQALKGLAAKHGGSLTTNPETGLPEAGFLSSVLPMVAGIGLDVLTDGALTPVLAGALVGGADYAMTGSLTQGVMAGLGAWGGAGMADSLSSMGAEGAIEDAAKTQAASLEGTTAGFDTATYPNLTQEQLTGYQDAFANAPSTEVQKGILQSAAQSNAALGSSATSTGTNFANMGRGLSMAANAPGAFLANNTSEALAATAPILTGAMNQNRSTIPTATQTNTNPFGLKTLSPNFQGTFPAQPNPHYQAQYTNYQQTPYSAKKGGKVPSYSGDSEYGSVVGIENATQDLEDLFGPRKAIATPTPSVGIVQDTDPNTRNLSPYDAALYRINQKATAAGLPKGAVNLPKATMKLGQINQDTTADTSDMASGGIAGLGGYASGGNPRLLSGPGDGMSDSIPANIGGKQPARLADGEFVVPADVVSHLGNGSTDAGAKKLYSMMDKIRSARTGRKKQAPAVKADKYIPK